MSPVTTYGVLSGAIAAEVAAKTSLARSDGVARLGPSLVSVIGYGFAFWMLAITLRVLPTGIDYAKWSGLGVVLIALVAWASYWQRLDRPAVLLLGLLVAGEVLVNRLSRTVPH